VFYVEFFRALHDEGVRYVLVGGIAVNLHGVERATADVDLLMALDSENLGRFQRVAKRFAMKPVVPVTLEDFADPAKVESWIREKKMIAFALRSANELDPTVDVLVQPVVAFEEAHARAVVKDLGGFRVTIATIEDLIRLKTGTGRHKDQADIDALTRVQELGLQEPGSGETR
jgi:predicted nucleotidyltransferase